LGALHDSDRTEVTGLGDALAGTVLVVAPHMDDEALACGGLIASRPDPRRVHVVYATDGMKSPAPIVPWRDAISPDLGERRRHESIAAMALFGVPETNLDFLGLPEAELPQHIDALAHGLNERIAALRPDCILVPFRYDRHPDHLAVNRAVTALKRSGATQAALLEYFVYHRWRLLPRRDVRAYVRPEYLLRLDIRAVAGLKRAALDCFETQTTRFYEWQTRPILQPALLDEECGGPEQFLRYDPALPGGRVFTGWVTWIHVVHWLEPVLLRWKYLLKSWGLRALGRRT
jgi:LmbE family N-acetylglucosaminyl deacetylase